ncbi:MAG: DsrE family protein [Ornithinibacter sp.]
MEPRATRLVVKVTCGTEALERLNQGFTVAATALASGLAVSLWLTGDASWMAVPGRAEEVELPYAVPLAELLDALVADGRVTVCGQCATRRGIAEGDLVAGVLVRGSAAFVEEVVSPGARALVY